MRNFLLIFILTLSFQSWTKADDIRDFQIEGMSIGDSLLDFATVGKINLGERKYYNDNKYTVTELYPDDFKIKKYTYDRFQFDFKEKDNKKIIKTFSGVVSYKHNIKDCYEKLDQVYKDVVSIFNTWDDLGKETYNHTGSGGKITDYVLVNKSRDEIQIACYDYFDDKINQDHFRISLRTFEYRVWLQEKAYN